MQRVCSQSPVKFANTAKDTSQNLDRGCVSEAIVILSLADRHTLQVQNDPLPYPNPLSDVHPVDDITGRRDVNLNEHAISAGCHNKVSIQVSHLQLLHYGTTGFDNSTTVYSRL